MTSIDIDELVARLDPECRGGRRDIDTVAAAVRAMSGHLDAPSVADLLLDTVRRGTEAGRWSVARTVVLRGTTTLPKSVLLRGRSTGADVLRPVDVPLRPELARWAASLPLSASQRDLLLAVNAWLRKTRGGQTPVVATAERAYEILRDEKAFDSTPPRGGATLWHADRITFDLLRCERIPTPLTWEPATPTVGLAGPIICVENHATFRTLLRVLRELPHLDWVAVAWVQGRNTAPLKSLTALPFPITRLDYLGDLDAAGLEIAAKACAMASRLGITAGPCVQLWELLLSQPDRAGRKVGNSTARRLVEWLPSTLQNQALLTLVSGRMIPQEALRYELLVDALCGS